MNLKMDQLTKSARRKIFCKHIHELRFSTNYANFWTVYQNSNHQQNNINIFKKPTSNIKKIKISLIFMVNQ